MKDEKVYIVDPEDLFVWHHVEISDWHETYKGWLKALTAPPDFYSYWDKDLKKWVKSKERALYLNGWKIIRNLRKGKVILDKCLDANIVPKEIVAELRAHVEEAEKYSSLSVEEIGDFNTPKPLITYLGL